MQVYLTGHRGGGFLKFADREELTAGQLTAAVAAARFWCLLPAVDTCQAASLPAALATPRTFAMASTLMGVQHKRSSLLPAWLAEQEPHLGSFCDGRCSAATMRQAACCCDYSACILWPDLELL